jgi:hypothetical protein
LYSPSFTALYLHSATPELEEDYTLLLH